MAAARTLRLPSGLIATTDETLYLEQTARKTFLRNTVYQSTNTNMATVRK